MCSGVCHVCSLVRYSTLGGLCDVFWCVMFILVCAMFLCFGVWCCVAEWFVMFLCRGVLFVGAL